VLLFWARRFRAKRELLETCEGLFPGSQGRNLAVTVLYVPSSLDSGLALPHPDSLSDYSQVDMSTLDTCQLWFAVESA